MSALLSLLWSSMELAGAVLFGAAFLKAKRSAKKTIAAIVLVGLADMIIILLNPSNIVRICLIAVFWTALYTYLYEGKLFHIILLVVVWEAMVTVAETLILYGASVLLKVSLQEFIWMKWKYAVTVTAVKAALLGITWFLYRRNSVSGAHIPPKQSLITLTFPVCSVMIVMVVFYSFSNSQEFPKLAALIAVVLVVANIAVLYAMAALGKASNQEKEAELLKQQIALQTASFAELEQNYSDQRRISHEFERHLQVLDDLLDRSDNEIAKDYIGQLQADRSLRLTSVHSHHPVIDVILNQKYQTACEKDIKMQVQVNDLSGIVIPTEAIVILMSNLLDNAIEACLRLADDRQIICKVLCEDALYLSIRNTSRPVAIHNGEIQTSKEDKRGHGYGLPAVKYILQEVGAEYVFDYRDGWFQFSAEIPNDPSKETQNQSSSAEQRVFCPGSAV